MLKYPRWKALSGRWSRKDELGFTLIELIIVLGIITMLSVGLLVGLQTFRHINDLDRAAAGTMELLRTARQRTVVGDQNDRWGVHVTSSQSELFQGSAYIGSNADKYDYPIRVTASWALMGGGNDIVFDRIDGTTGMNGTITLTGVGGETRVMTILSSGESALIGALPPQLLTRVTDTRHAHLTLTYDLSTAAVLQLKFTDPPNPDVIENITIADYVSVSGDEFLWEDTIDVNGDAETLRLVSHTLNPKTVLSVRRDRDDNAKAVEMLVDGFSIATYSATGVILAGAGVTVAVQ